MSAAPPRIGIYVHHHGGGHAARAGAIGRALDERGAAVSYLSSVPGLLTGPGETVELPLDTDLGRDPGETPAELHFAPLGSDGLADRMALIAAWIARRRPQLLLVDVSVEVAMLARLCGVPFVYMRQTGRREDPPHRLAYRWAAGLAAPWPDWLEPAGTPGEVAAKTRHLGAVTRFDGAARPGRRRRSRRVLVLGEAGGLTDEIALAAPTWEVLGPRPVSLDLLERCAVVVAPGGANAVAEAAFARCGLVCVPRPRPFGEQVARGAALRARAAAVVLGGPAGGGDATGGERARDWPRLLEVASARSGALSLWADGGGAGRAADYLLGLAASAEASASSSHSIRPRAASSASQPRAGQVPQRSR